MAETQYITSVRLCVRPSPSACASLESYAPAIGLSGHLPWDRELCCSSIYYLIYAISIYQLEWYICIAVSKSYFVS